MGKKKTEVAEVPPLRLEYRTPAELAENPANWRRHPSSQISALTDVIAEVGWAGACLYNATTGRLLDGHARKKVALEQGCELVPVLVGSWTEEQERKILATLDPLAAMAEMDEDAFRELRDMVDTESPELRKMLDGLCKDKPAGEESASEDQVTSKFEVLVECNGEETQRELFERLSAEGYNCRVLTL